MKATAALAILAVLAGCSKSGEGDNADDFAKRMGSNGSSASVGKAAPLAEANAQPVAAPTGKAMLTPLAAAAPKAMGAIARACTFVYQGRTLLVAGADDASGAGARGVLVIDGKETSLPGTPTGGKQVLANGLALAGAGYTVKVVPGTNAMLSIAGPQGQTNFSPGTWTCAS